jgi:Dr1-associated corepressor
MFLGMIVEEASKVTTERGSKKLEAYHLYVLHLNSQIMTLIDRVPVARKYHRKHAIETVDVLDFLKEIVEAVPDPSAGGTIDLAAEAAEKAAAKKRASRRKPAAEGEEGAAPAPRRRRKKEDGEGTQGKSRPRGRAKAAPEEEEMDQEEDEPEPEEGMSGHATGSRVQDDEDDWEG